MADLTSLNWDEENGVCTKHELPCVPCPACIAEQDEDIEVQLSPIERDGWVDEIAVPIGFEDRLP